MTRPLSFFPELRLDCPAPPGDVRSLPGCGPQKMTEQDLKVFLDQTRSFFMRLSDEPAQLGDTRVAFEAPKLEEFTGLLELTGQTRGYVCLSLSRALLLDLLAAIGERSTSDGALADMVGEVANIVASQARRTLGSGTQISTPTPIMGAANGPALHTPVLVTPVEWNGHHGHIILALESA